ncbi:MAG TPA: SDR family oxidoreductase [Acidimicrobiia bacterium]|nr:SDR family oxidoreductase [Acidimicrobiia bacterium]
MWEIDLSGTTALVTGASRGIGRAIALGLAEAGADVVVTARSEGDLESLGEEIKQRGPASLPLAADLADGDSIGELVHRAWGWNEGLDVLVNAAGIIIRRDPPDATGDDFDQVMAVNLRAPFLLTQAIGWQMRDRGTGSIVNVASVAGEEVTGASLIYQASKAGLVHLTRGFASRLAPSVRVNAVGPGYIRTSLNEEWLSNADNARYVKERTASGRVGVPEDVVGAVVFLASPAASYVNGQHLRIDGGWGF